MRAMDADDLRSLSRVLIFGTDATRRALAVRMSADPTSELPRVLLETVRSEESSLLRDRCMVILGIMAASGHASAIDVLDELRASAPA